jgi:hypothetical protein
VPETWSRGLERELKRRGPLARRRGGALTPPRANRIGAAVVAAEVGSLARASCGRRR